MSEYVRWLSKYPYAEVRIARGTETQLLWKDGEWQPVVGPAFGASVRVLDNGSWGFASTTTESEIRETIAAAARLARLTSGTVALDEMPAIQTHTRASRSVLSLEEKMMQLNDAIQHADAPSIQNRSFRYAESEQYMEFYNSEGSEILQDTFHAYFSCQCIARKADSIQRGHSRTSSIESFERLPVSEICADAAQKAARLLDAHAPPRGRFTVILDNEMTGVFSHEAIGHACEGDSIVERESILREKLGQKIGSELATIIDDPSYVDFGRYTYDEEGVAGERTLLVENGMLRNYLSSRDTSHALQLPANGHARAMDYDAVPIVRMSNTHFLPGKTKKEELFDVPHAIYAKGMNGGSVDIFTGAYMFKAEEAWEIKNGNREKLFRDVTLRGDILETLNGVEAVGDDFATNPGFCGKMGQSVPVSDGGPHVRVKTIALG